MSARSKARKGALDLLYEGDIRKVDPGALVDARVDLELRPLTREILEMVSEHRRKIDELIAAYARGWDMDRMPAVDRNILRMAIAELIWSRDVPEAVAISEALDLAKELSTDESAGFIHGVLAQIAPLKATLA